MPSNVPVIPKPRPYRRFLTSALHTRFVHAAGIAILWHLSIAGFASDWYSSVSSFFWAFFPLGTAGIRAGLFSLSSLFIFMLQIATFKIGKRCTPSNWTSLRSIFLSYSTYATVLWYLASAWWFCEVFVWTSPASQGLGWIVNGGYGAPDKLNERPIYLRLFFLVLGFVQSLVHIYNDYSSIPVRVTPEQNAITADQPETRTKELPVIAAMLGKGPLLATQAVSVSSISTVLGPFLYTAFFRKSLWSWHIWWAKPFANIARSDSAPPQGFYIGSIMLHAFLFGTLLSLTWELNILLFESYMLQEPTRNGRPLTASSKDPNGSLLSGLRAKRDLVSTFAFWELDVIAHKHLERRKDIFGDFERLGQAPMFTQMFNAALQVIAGIETRINALDPATSGVPLTQQPQSDNNAPSLPRILPYAIPSKNPIFQPTNVNQRTSSVTNAVANGAKSLGSSPNAWSPPVDRAKQRAIEYASPTIKELRGRVEAAEQSPLGRYLLTTPTRLIRSAVLGTPTGNPALTIYATTSITAMLLASLREDTYGKAVQCVPPAVQALTKTIFAIENLVHRHTNGGLVAKSAAKDLEDVQLVLDHLRSSLKKLLSAFQMFLSDIGLNTYALNNAQKAAEPRELFKVILPSPKDNNEQGERTSDRGRSNREMQEVSDRRVDLDRQQKEQEAQVAAREGRRKASEAESDKQRPGRLFKQLDQANMQNKSEQKERSENGGGSMRERPKTKQIEGPANVKENPFGARDFNTMPTGGLQRRRVAEVR